MVLAGSVLIVHEARDRIFQIHVWGWLAILTGGVLLFASLCWDWRNIASAALPNTFPWLQFAVG